MEKGKGKGKEKEKEKEKEKDEETEAEAEERGADTSPKWQESTLTQEQIDLVHEFVREQASFEAIAEMMGLEEGTKEHKDLRIVYVEAGFEKARDFDARVNEVFAEDESQMEKEDEDEDEDKKFQAYDPVLWETAVEEDIVETVSSEEEGSISHALEKVLEAYSKIPSPSPGPLTSENPHRLEGIKEEEDGEEEVKGSASPEPDFVRAPKDSRAGSKPYFRKGDILRVINRAQRGSLADGTFELLPFKPPGEAGVARIQDFEPADQQAVNEVGMAARTEKEKDSFQYAFHWKD